MSPVSSGTSPLVTSTVPLRSAGRASRPHSTARPVPLTSSWSAKTRSGSIEAAHRDDPVAVVAHDHTDVLGPGGARRPDGVADQGDPADRVQDLGSRGLHPGALAGSEDDDGGRAGGAHARGLQTCCGVPRDARHATGRGWIGRRAGWARERTAGRHGIRHNVRSTTTTGPPRPVSARGAGDDGDGQRGEGGVARRAELLVHRGCRRRGRPGRHGGHRHPRRQPGARPDRRRGGLDGRRPADRFRGRHRRPRRRRRCPARRPAAVPRRHAGAGPPGGARWPRRRGRGDDDHRCVAHRRRRGTGQPAGRRVQPAHLPVRAERLGQDLRPRGAARAAAAADRPADGRVRPQRRLRLPRQDAARGAGGRRPSGSPSAT